MELKFLKTKDYTVKDPKFNIGEDAGIDFFVPDDTPKFRNALLEKNPDVQLTDAGIRVRPMADVLIPSGIYARFPNNVALVGANKSGVATKNKLVYGAHLIDASYEGIIHLHMINTSLSPCVIPFGAKIMQFVPTLIALPQISIEEETTVNKEQFYEGHKSERKDGGFGSTGIK